MTHELAHCLFGPEEKHGKNFKAAVTKLGLEGKATATVAGPGWNAWADPILEKLGPIPHARLDTSTGATRTKQKTYLPEGDLQRLRRVPRCASKTPKWSTLIERECATGSTGLHRRRVRRRPGDRRS